MSTVHSQGIVRSDRNLAQTEFKIRPRMAKLPVSAADDEDDDDAGAAANDATATGSDINDINNVLLNNDQKVVMVPSAPRLGDAENHHLSTGDSEDPFINPASRRSRR